MQLTTHTDYALRLLIYLAIAPAGRSATVQDAASRYGISANHMARVAQTLVQLGYIHSRRGRGGGLELAHAPGTLRLGRLVRETENLQLLECFGPASSCPIEPSCQLKRVLSRAQEAFLEVLDEFTLADITTGRAGLNRLLALEA